MYKYGSVKKFVNRDTVYGRNTVVRSTKRVICILPRESHRSFDQETRRTMPERREGTRFLFLPFFSFLFLSFVSFILSFSRHRFARLSVGVKRGEPKDAVVLPIDRTFHLGQTGGCIAACTSLLLSFRCFKI